MAAKKQSPTKTTSAKAFSNAALATKKQKKVPTPRVATASKARSAKITPGKTSGAKSTPAEIGPAKIGALAVGDAAPDFTLPSSDGREVTLSALAGKHVVVYFYPRDDTPGCTRQAQGFRDARAELARRGAVVLGVSKDSVESHCRFRDKHSLDFPLLSDRDGAVIARWGAWGEKNMYGKKSMGIVRSTVIVAPDGTVKKVFPKVKVDEHVRDVLAAIDA